MNQIYWLVGNHIGDVFSLNQAEYVVTTDATYTAWVAAGNRASIIANDGELGWALMNVGMPAALVVAALGSSPTMTTLTLSQGAETLLGAGLTITSTGTPALNATYPVDAITQQQINAEITSILLNSAFTDGTTTLTTWLDVTGTAHSFSITNYKNFATAFASFVTGCAKCINGQASSLPATTATIA